MDADSGSQVASSPVPLEDKTSFLSHVRATTLKNLSVMVCFFLSKLLTIEKRRQTILVSVQLFVPVAILIGFALIHWLEKGERQSATLHTNQQLSKQIYYPNGYHLRGPNLSDDVILGSISSTVNQTVKHHPQTIRLKKITVQKGAVGFHWLL